MIARQLPAPSRIHSIASDTCFLVPGAVAVCPRRPIRCAMRLVNRWTSRRAIGPGSVPSHRPESLPTSAEDLGDDLTLVNPAVCGYRLPLAVRRVPLEISETYPFESGVGGVRD